MTQETTSDKTESQDTVATATMPTTATVATENESTDKKKRTIKPLVLEEVLAKDLDSLNSKEIRFLAKSKGCLIPARLKKAELLAFYKTVKESEESGILNANHYFRVSKRKKLGNLILLPRSNEGFFLRFDMKNKYALSVVLPEKKRHSIAYARYSDETFHWSRVWPKLLFSATISKKRFHKDDYHLYECDSDFSKGIRGRIYDIANIYSGGRICFGSKTFDSVRNAVTSFFQGPFNKELTPNGGFSDLHKGCTKTVHKCNRKNIACRHRLVQRSSMCSCKTPKDSRVFSSSCQDCGGRNFKEYNDVVAKYLGKDLNGREKLVDPCSLSLFLKEKVCGCECDCSCCRSSCHCPCECYPTENDRFRLHLETFSPKHNFVNITRHILGSNLEEKKYLAYSKRADGVIVVKDEKIIKKLGLESQIKDDDSVFGVVRQKDDYFYASFGQKILKFQENDVYIR